VGDSCCTMYFKQALRDRLIEHKHYIRKHGNDLPEIADWRWNENRRAGGVSPLFQAGVRTTSTEGDNV
jgi:xylulose-5-phosphate/fructose-6-phosphate phosphoketolase